MSGQTTRADVILALGDPDRKTNNDSRFHYVRATEEGGIAFMVGGGLGESLAQQREGYPATGTASTTTTTSNEVSEFFAGDGI